MIRLVLWTLQWTLYEMSTSIMPLEAKPYQSMLSYSQWKYRYHKTDHNIPWLQGFSHGGEWQIKLAWHIKLYEGKSHQISHEIWYEILFHKNKIHITIKIINVIILKVKGVTKVFLYQQWNIQEKYLFARLWNQIRIQNPQESWHHMISVVWFIGSVSFIFYQIILL